MTESAELDHYLVLSDHRSAAVSSRGGTRPWCIDAVYLFDARQLRDEQIARGVKRGVASSVRQQQWAAAEIFPRASALLPLTANQSHLLTLFHHDALGYRY